MSTGQEKQFPYSIFGLAVAAGALFVGGSFFAAGYTQHLETLFAVSPSVPTGKQVPQLDVIPETKVYAFHATIFTIWATMLLCLPAFCLVLFVRRHQKAEAYWLSFWTVGLVAMLVHLYLAMGVLFEWNWQHILEDTVRVTIPKPDLVLAVWWTVDVALGWALRNSKSILVHGQRTLLHVALLIIFLIGFIREGEILVSKLIGVGSAVAVLVSVLMGVVYFSQKQRTSA